MKFVGSVLIAALLAVAVDAFTPQKHSGLFFGQFLSAKKTTSSEPYFIANEDNNDDEVNAPAIKPTPPKNPPPPPKPIISDELQEEMKKVSDTLMKEVVNPLLSGDIEKGVPANAIKGAALTGATVSLLAGQGLALTGAAGLGAAFVAISPGMGGKAVRAVGGAAWESAQAATELYEKYGTGRKLSRTAEKLVNATMDALQKKSREEARLADEEAKELEQVQVAERKKEEARIAEEKRKENEARLEKEKLAEEKRKAEEAKAKQAEEESMAKAEAFRKAAEKKQKVEEARLAAGAKAAEEARLAEEERKGAEEEAEKERLAEQMRQEDEARLMEESRKRDEARKEEEARLKGDIAVEEDDDLKATIRMAEQILDGTIAGLDDAIADTNVKEEWNSAGRLAQELGKGPSAEGDAQEDEDVDALSDEEDMATLAQAAREAVEKFEAEMKSQDATRTKQRELWDSEMVTDEDFDYDEDLEEQREEYDAEEDEDMEELEVELDTDEDFDEYVEALGTADVDLEELGRAARAAVEEFESESFSKFKAQESDPDDHLTVTDWSKFTVVQLREELKSRGLNTKGKKAELVATLTNDDLDTELQEEETGEGDVWESEIMEEPTMEDIEEAAQDEPDLEEMGRAAREAVKMFEEQEAEEDIEVEYETMTVNELKDELRNRGLKISGRKAELIERLRSS